MMITGPYCDFVFKLYLIPPKELCKRRLISDIAYLHVVSSLEMRFFVKIAYKNA